MTTNECKIVRQGRIQGGGGTVSVLCTHSSQNIFFSQGGNPFFPLENWISPIQSKLRWLTTCLILDILNVRESKGSGIMLGMKLPAQSWKTYLDLPRFFTLIQAYLAKIWFWHEILLLLTTHSSIKALEANPGLKTPLPSQFIQSFLLYTLSCIPHFL